MAWTPGGQPAPLPPAYPEHEVWRVVKDTRAATASIRDLPHGRELRVLVGDDLLTAIVYRPGEANELAEMATGLRQSFEAKGWTLLATDDAVTH